MKHAVNGGNWRKRRWLGLLLSLCLIFGLCPMVQAASVSEVLDRMNGVRAQISSLETELERDYPNVVSVNGEIIRSNPLTVKVMKLFGYEYYVVQNPVADSTYMLGLYYNNCHKVTGSTVIYVDGVATNATVVGTGYPRAKEIKRQLNDLNLQLADLDDELYAAQLEEKYRPIAERNDHLKSLKSVRQDGVRLVFKVGNPYLLLCGLNKDWVGVMNDEGQYWEDGKEVFPLEPNETDRDWGAYIEDGNLAATPVIIDGSTMIPIRPLVEWLGGIVNWDGNTNTIGCQLRATSIFLTIGSNIAYVNGVAKEMPVAVTVYNGKTVVPLRFISENLGHQVEWIQGGQYIRVYEWTDDTPQPAMPAPAADSHSGTTPDLNAVADMLGNWDYPNTENGLSWMSITQSSTDGDIKVRFVYDNFWYWYEGKLLLDEEGDLYADMIPVDPGYGGDWRVLDESGFRLYVSYVGDAIEVYTNYTGDKSEPHTTWRYCRSTALG